jgi:hypothetical protein
MNAIKAENLLAGSYILDHIETLRSGLTMPSDGQKLGFEDYFAYLQSQVDGLPTIGLKNSIPKGQEGTYHVELVSAMEEVGESILKVHNQVITFQRHVVEAETAVGDAKTSFEAWFMLALEEFLQTRELNLPAKVRQSLAASEFSRLLNNAPVFLSSLQTAIKAEIARLDNKKKMATKKYDIGQQQVNMAWTSNVVENAGFSGDGNRFGLVQGARVEEEDEEESVPTFISQRTKFAQEPVKATETSPAGDEGDGPAIEHPAPTIQVVRTTVDEEPYAYTVTSRGRNVPVVLNPDHTVSLKGGVELEDGESLLGQGGMHLLVNSVGERLTQIVRPMPNASLVIDTAQMAETLKIDVGQAEPHTSNTVTQTVGDVEYVIGIDPGMGVDHSAAVVITKVDGVITDVEAMDPKILEADEDGNARMIFDAKHPETDDFDQRVPEFDQDGSEDTSFDYGPDHEPIATDVIQEDSKGAEFNIEYVPLPTDIKLESKLVPDVQVNAEGDLKVTSISAVPSSSKGFAKTGTPQPVTVLTDPDEVLTPLPRRPVVSVVEELEDNPSVDNEIVEQMESAADLESAVGDDSENFEPVVTASSQPSPRRPAVVTVEDELDDLLIAQPPATPLPEPVKQPEPVAVTTSPAPRRKATAFVYDGD